MECELEESEIKIEYYESNCEDPLQNYSECPENSNENCEENISYEPEAISPNNFKQSESQRKTWYKAIDDSGRYICRFCELSYSTIQTLRHHTKTKHQDKANNLKNIISHNKRKKRIRCHVCKENFTEVEYLKNHVKTVHFKGNAENFCHICQAVFEDEKSISDHFQTKHNIKQHSKLHICSICGYGTLKVSHFNQHLNTHTEMKPLKCSHCDYVTNYLPNLRTHERLHSSEKPYVCDFKGCSYTAAAQSALRSHKLKHYPEENVLYCDKCTYKTAYRQSLKKHRESHERNSIKMCKLLIS